MNIFESFMASIGSALTAIVGCLMLPLLMMAILNGIMSGSGSFIAASLAEGLQIIAAFVGEIILRFLHLAIACAASLCRLLIRLAVALFGSSLGKK